MKVECYEVLGYKVKCFDKAYKWIVEESTFGTEEEVLDFMEKHKGHYTFVVDQIRRMVVAEN